MQCNWRFGAEPVSVVVEWRCDTTTNVTTNDRRKDGEAKSQGDSWCPLSVTHATGAINVTTNDCCRDEVPTMLEELVDQSIASLPLMLRMEPDASAIGASACLWTVLPLIMCCLCALWRVARSLKLQFLITMTW
jgi:hypothetical protein